MTGQCLVDPIDTTAEYFLLCKQERVQNSDKKDDSKIWALFLEILVIGGWFT